MRREHWAGMDVVVTGGTDRRGGGNGLTVVLMHGFGAPGEDLVGVWRMLEVPAEVRFVFPAAPMELPPTFAGGRAWWMIDVEALERSMASGHPLDRADDEPDGLDAARERILELLDVTTRELGSVPSATVLGGFSQGAMLACDVAFRTSVELAGLVLMSGTLLASSKWLPGMPARKGTPVFQSHGRQDPLLSFSAAQALRGHLGAAGLNVRWVEFNGGHDIPNIVTDGVARFIRELPRALPG